VLLTIIVPHRTFDGPTTAVDPSPDGWPESPDEFLDDRNRLLIRLAFRIERAQRAERDR
jgi:hypothetical protein